MWKKLNVFFCRTFEDRLDLLSIMIEGPQNTPYEGGLFFFDIQLSKEYPNTPPLCHYISYCTDRLNPNLYEDGKVCVSLLGTWSGRGTEVWSSTNSTLLQVIVSIQGLILVDEPYFNEAGYEKQRGGRIFFFNHSVFKLFDLVQKGHNKDKKILACTMKWWC
jgi:ubiquitin-conjugating enzyme E2 O